MLMHSRIREYFQFFILFAMMMALSACVMEARGIPVKNYRPPAADAALFEKQQKEMLDDVARMSREGKHGLYGKTGRSRICYRTRRCPVA